MFGLSSYRKRVESYRTEGSVNDQNKAGGRSRSTKFRQISSPHTVLLRSWPLDLKCVMKKCAKCHLRADRESRDRANCRKFEMSPLATIIQLRHRRRAIKRRRGRPRGKGPPPRPRGSHGHKQEGEISLVRFGISPGN